MSAPFKLRSGNSPLFKVMGSSPFKDDVPAKATPPKKETETKDTTKKEDKKGVYESITGKKFKDTRVGGKIAKVKDKIETWQKNNPEKAETLGKIGEALGTVGSTMASMPTPTGGEELMNLANVPTGPSESAEIPSVTAETVGSELPDAPSGPVMKKSPTKIYGKGGKRKKNWKKY